MNHAADQAKSLNPSSSAGPVIRAVLTSRTHSLGNRRLAKNIVWRWVSSRWPLLVPTASTMERSHIESGLPNRQLSVTTSDDGSVWILKVSIQERETAPIWTTRAMVADSGSTDVVAVQTSCSNISAAPVVAPPALLSTWVDRLQLQDGVMPVLAQPRLVLDESHAEELMASVSSAARKLPVLLLAAKGDSKFYGADPRVLAQSVAGLAHVACLAAPALRAWVRMCGRACSPVPGAVRIYLPGFAPGAGTLNGRPTSFAVGPAPIKTETDKAQANNFRPKLRQILCGLSVAEEDATHAFSF